MWVETFGPQFLTKDVLDFCEGWFETQSLEFTRNLVSRLMDVLQYMFGNSVADVLSHTSTQAQVPIQLVIGNAARNWLAICNVALNTLVKQNGEEELRAWENRIEQENFRQAVYLSSPVTPIKHGDAESLFRHTGKLIIDKEDGLSQVTMRSLLDFLNITSNNRRNEMWSLHNFDILRLNIFDELIIETHGFDNSFAAHAPIEKTIADLEALIKKGYESNVLQEIVRKAIQSNPKSKTTDKLIEKAIFEFLRNQTSLKMHDYFSNQAFTLKLSSKK